MLNKPFVKKDEMAKFFDDIIKDEIKRRNLEFNHEIFNPANITECDRRILYRARGEKSEKQQSTLDKDAQEAVKDKWLNFFSKSRKVKLLDKNIVAADCNYNLTGKVDGVLRVGDLKTVLMVKALQSQDFVLLETTGAIRKHIVEIIVHMWLMEIKNGLLLYDNKNTNEFCIYHAVPFTQIIEASCKKCKKLLLYKIKGEVPQRSYKDKKNAECEICEFNIKCWNKE